MIGTESNAGLAPIRVRINKLEGSRIEVDVNPATVTFDVDVSMDETRRTNEELTISFLLSISTKPSLVRFEAGGTAVITGGRAAFDAALEIDEETSVPKVLHHIYQHVFTSLYLIASQMGTPYPPPDLIHAPSETRDLGPQLDQEQMVAEQAAQQAT
ncbi:MAG: hypothetical protein JSV18_06765 [Candidatus Bathyarchaeota archaeon]|nr:MAG: hypothetical protein JSV18_06765 [Candidatus Bathyarchaeota archaeon]